MKTIERPRDRRELVAAAGLRTTSLVSILAGVTVAFGALGLLLAVAAGIGELFDVDTADLNGDNWQDIGIGGAIAFAVLTLVAYAFGGYTAGRMARRAGIRHGLLVFVLGVLLTLGVAGIASGLGDTDAVADELRDQGVPSDPDDWTGVGVGAGVAVLAAMLVGSVLGGTRGERWHGRLVTRAADPDVHSRQEAHAEQVAAAQADTRERVQEQETTRLQRNEPPPEDEPVRNESPPPPPPPPPTRDDAPPPPPPPPSPERVQSPPPPAQDAPPGWRPLDPSTPPEARP